MPKISVIMGVYNCKNTDLLLKSVNSIIEQTFTDWEFFICNDGSTDDTLTTLKNIEAMDERIKILTYNENHGLAYALNVCIENANGEFIARQDDDDISLPERFAKQIDFLNKHKEYDIVGSCADVYDDSGIWGAYTVEEKPDKKAFLWNSPFAHPTVMFRTKALKDSGGYRVAKETRRCEDYDLFMQMYSLGYIGYNIQEKIYLYRIENNNKKYRPMKYRVDEAVVRWKGYKKLKLFPLGFLYVMKPIIIGLIPQKIFRIIRKNQY